MSIILILFFLKFFIALQSFNAHEQSPPLFPNFPDKQQPFGHGVTPVSAGLFIKNMTEFNIQEDTFELEGTLWFDFNPNIVSLNSISGFQFDNGFLIEKSEPHTKFIGQRLFVTYDIRVKFLSSLVQTLFPLNDHRLYLVLKNDKLSPDEIHYEVNEKGVQMASTVQPKGWVPISYDARTGYIKSALDQGDSKKILSFPSIIFSFSFAKPGFRHVLVILGPSIILFFFGLLGLLIHQQPALQFPVTIGSLSGLLIYRFVIEGIIPHVGYFTLTDYLYFIFLASTFIVLILNVYELEKPLSRTFKTAIFYALQIFALATLVILI